MRNYVHLTLVALVTLATGPPSFASPGPALDPRAVEAPNRDDPPAPPADLVDRVVRGDRAAAGAASYQLEQAIEAGSEAGRAAAQALLSRRAEVTTEAEVVALVDDLAARDESPLAARLLLRIVRAKAAVATYGKGNVAVGRVVLADGKLDTTLVLAQMEILPAGYFAGEVGDLQRPIGFRAAGYEGREVALAGRSGPVVCLGTITLTPLPADQAATVRGVVTLEDAQGAGTTSVLVHLDVPKPNTPHNGYAGRRGWPESIVAPVASDGSFEARNLTPGDYTVIVLARRHVRNTKRLHLDPTQVADVGTVALRSSDIGFDLGKVAPATGDLPWEKDFSTAAQRAKAEGKPLMVMMTATWCGPCKMLEKETLTTPWVRYFLKPFVIVQAYEDREVEAKYGLNGYPTLVFTDADGKEACRTVGYQETVPFAGVVARAYENLKVAMPPELREMIDRKIVTPARPLTPTNLAGESGRGRI